MIFKWKKKWVKFFSYYSNSDSPFKLFFFIYLYYFFIFKEVLYISWNIKAIF